jgi:TPR repeat protein
MKKLFRVTPLLLYLFITLLAFSNADATSPATVRQDFTAQDTEECQQIEKNKKLKSEKSGLYYFLLAYCHIDHINDDKTFNEVVSLLQQSIQQKFLVSHFALAELYWDKYKMGGLLYGAKGKPNDLITAINNYEKAADHGSTPAQNNLGEIYLDYANLNVANRNAQENAKEIKNVNAPIQLPDLDKAVYWLTKAAKNGNPAAQGTLSDLYKQGIGVPQDYVLAYVWQTLAIASQTRFNSNMHNNIGKALIAGNQKTRDHIYEILTEAQKNEAQKLLKEYTTSYFTEPSLFSMACQETQTMISTKNIQKMLKKAITKTP